MQSLSENPVEEVLAFSSEFESRIKVQKVLMKIKS